MSPSEDFAAFYAGCGPRLLHLAQLLTGQADDAEDLLQEVFARTYLRWDRIRMSDPYAYVRRGLVNARTDRWRRRLPLPVEIDERHLVTTDHAGEVVHRDEILQALRALTARERTVVALRFFEDMSERETAVTLGVPTGTVKSTMNRAIGKLRADPSLRGYLVGEPR